MDESPTKAQFKTVHIKKSKKPRPTTGNVKIPSIKLLRINIKLADLRSIWGKRVWKCETGSTRTWLLCASARNLRKKPKFNSKIAGSNEWRPWAVGLVPYPSYERHGFKWSRRPLPGNGTSELSVTYGNGLQMAIEDRFKWYRSGMKVSTLSLSHEGSHEWGLRIISPIRRCREMWRSRRERIHCLFRKFLSFLFSRINSIAPKPAAYVIEPEANCEW